MTGLIVRENDPTELKLVEISDTAAQCSLSALRGMNDAQKTLRIARGTMAIDKAMQDGSITALLKSLCGHELGFGSDKDYGDQILRRAAIVALMKGARLTSFDGPEWIILSGKAYLCKPFYRRRLQEMEGISNIVVRCEQHEQKDTQTAWVPVTVELRDNGKLRKWHFRCEPEKDGYRPDNRIGVRVNAGMGVDAIRGKAEAKALRHVYLELSGEDIPDDPPESAPIDIVAEVVPPPEPEEPPQRPVDACRASIDAATNVTAIRSAVEFHWPHLSEQERAAISDYADLAGQGIKSQRGENSNRR